MIHVQALVMGMTLLVAGFLVLLPLPGGVAPSLPWVAALWAALLAVTLGIQVQAACVRSCDVHPPLMLSCLASNEYVGSPMSMWVVLSCQRKGDYKGSS